MKIAAAIMLLLSASSYANANSIDKEAVRRVMKANTVHFKECYDKELAAAPQLNGKIVFDWSISDTGSVTTAKVKTSTLQNKNAENCMLTLLISLKFPEAQKGTTANIIYPMLFSSIKK